MLQRITIYTITLIALVFGLISCCRVLRDQKFESNTTEVKGLIKIGDDIFEAKEKLEKRGFKIKSEPAFATKNKDYYLMLVDYGLRPNAWEKMKLAAGLPGIDKPLSGIIEADEGGKIYKIE